MGGRGRRDSCGGDWAPLTTIAAVSKEQAEAAIARPGARPAAGCKPPAAARAGPAPGPGGSSNAGHHQPRLLVVQVGVDDRRPALGAHLPDQIQLPPEPGPEHQRISVLRPNRLGLQRPPLPVPCRVHPPDYPAPSTPTRGYGPSRSGSPRPWGRTTARGSARSGAVGSNSSSGCSTPRLRALPRHAAGQPSCYQRPTLFTCPQIISPV